MSQPNRSSVTYWLVGAAVIFSALTSGLVFSQGPGLQTNPDLHTTTPDFSRPPQPSATPDLSFAAPPGPPGTPGVH